MLFLALIQNILSNKKIILGQREYNITTIGMDIFHN